MKKIPPIVWGIAAITILFLAIVILISSFRWIKGSISRTPSPATPPSRSAGGRAVTTTPTATASPTLTPTPTNLPWSNQGTVLYFPVLPLNIYQYSLIQIKNTGTGLASDITVTLLNRQGASRTYPVRPLEPGAIDRFSLKNLAELPINFSPGLAVVSSNSSLAAVTETFPSNSDERNPVESLAPIPSLPSDLDFKIYPTTGSEPAQNRLSLTNPESKLIEVQVILTTPEQGTQILLTKEIQPLTTEVIKLPIATFKSFDQTATVIVSSSDRIIGAIYRLDKDGGLLSNISME